VRRVAAAVKGESPYAAAFVEMQWAQGPDGLQTLRDLWRADGELQIGMCTGAAE
jgi:hypothetical protein